MRAELRKLKNGVRIEESLPGPCAFAELVQDDQPEVVYQRLGSRPKHEYREEEGRRGSGRIRLPGRTGEEHENNVTMVCFVS